MEKAKPKLVQLKVVGLFPTEPYQRAKHYTQYLFAKMPFTYSRPTLRPMFDMQWTEFLQKSRRNLGALFWKLDSPVAVFLDDVFIGDDVDLVRYCGNTYAFHIFDNFILSGQKELQNFICSSERNHVYFIISVDDEVIGTLLIELYNDLVPLTCSNFMRLVNKKKRGYNKAPIHRIAKSAWIQIGGYNLSKEHQMCENYVVPHDQRGVLSMCNGGKHKKNSTQFFISLQAAEWMDYTYVAFGHVVHGEDVLQQIENVETRYDTPVVPVVVEECGEYAFVREPDASTYRLNAVYYEDKHEFYSKRKSVSNLEGISVYDTYPDDIYDTRDVDSNLSMDGFYQGLYSIDQK